MIQANRILLYAYSLITVFSIINVLAEYNPNKNYNHQYNSKNVNYGGYGHVDSHGYAVSDSRYFRHGTPFNEVNGGTCTEFLRINSLNKCCAQRDDDCYMIHYDTRCYCDVFCDRSNVQDNSDCCPDAGETCSGKVEPTTTPTPESMIFYMAMIFTIFNKINC